MTPTTYIPSLRWIREYQPAHLRNDMIAGATIWAVMVPTALAYTSIAGVYPIVGLHTVPLTLIMYALFGTSKCLVVGPDSATALLSAHIVSTLAVVHTHHYLMLTSSLALFIGMVFLAFGFLQFRLCGGGQSVPIHRQHAGRRQDTNEQYFSCHSDTPYPAFSNATV